VEIIEKMKNEIREKKNEKTTEKLLKSFSVNLFKTFQ